MGCAESPIQAAVGVTLLEALVALGSVHKLCCKEDSRCLSAHAVQPDLATAAGWALPLSPDVTARKHLLRCLGRLVMGRRFCLPRCFSSKRVMLT